MWVIEDGFHGGELIGEFPTREGAIAELRCLALVPWDEEPNQAPCMSWQTCGREYELVEYHVSTSGYWKQRQRLAALNVSQEAVAWLLQ